MNKTSIEWTDYTSNLIRGQCRAAEVPVFVKQLGAREFPS